MMRDRAPLRLRSVGSPSAVALAALLALSGCYESALVCPAPEVAEDAGADAGTDAGAPAYTMIPEPLAFVDAESACEDVGGRLAQVHGDWTALIDSCPIGPCWIDMLYVRDGASYSFTVSHHQPSLDASRRDDPRATFFPLCEGP